MIGSVYRLDFSSGKSYVGATTQPLAQRIRRHKAAALRGIDNQFEVHRAWIEFGDPTVVLLAEVDKAQLAQTEIDAIAKYGTLFPNGYNLTTGGRRTKFTAEQTREKKVLANKGRTFSAETIEKMRKSARNRDPSKRHNLSQFWKGKKQSAEHIAKRIRPKGWNHSDEAKEKMSEAKLK